MSISRNAAAAAAALLALAAGLTGCGGSSSSTTTTSSSTAISSASAQSTTSSSTASTSTATQQAAAPKQSSKHKKLSVRVYNPKAKQHAKTTTGNLDDKETNAAHRAQNPCTLVTSGEASAILHATVHESEAPLGPTCILGVPGRKQPITLAVETASVQRVVSQMKQKPTQVKIAGHVAYCGTLGSTLLNVELTGGRILAIAAPCGTAEALAAKALPRIKA